MKKVISILLCLSMVMSVVFAQVSASSSAIDELISFKIVEGDENGDLNLEGEVTRGQMAKIIVTALGISDINAFDTVFDDVKSTYWASGYIDMAQKFGIIHGMGDGTFLPENPVTNEQAVKMIICALGYEPLCLSRGVYPYSYMQVASQHGLLDDLDLLGTANAKRKDVFVLIHNALDIPLMKQTGYGADVEYTLMNGQNGIELQTLRTLYFE